LQPPLQALKVIQMKLPGDNAVPTKISGMEVKPVRVASGAAAQKKSEQTAGKAERSVAEDKLHLTGSARGIAALEQSLKDLPAVDETRVAAVRERIESGNYKVDPQRIADKLMHLESQLARSNPLNRSLLK
jgi:negative regulator of flagellin synthesis FlgM